MRGKAVDGAGQSEGGEDHPRVCGEKPPSCPEMSTNEGSPPRMRGKDVLHCNCLSEFGITPAYAGKSDATDWTTMCRSGSPPRVRGKVLLSVHFWFWYGDHPRVCGEKVITHWEQSNRAGSPPRVRGKVQMVFVGLARSRITPACAGKRLKRSHSIGHFSCILCLFHSVLHRASVSGGSRAGPCAPPCLPAQNAVPV